MPELNDSIRVSDLRMRFQLRQPKSYYRLQVGVVDPAGNFELVEEINNPGTGMTAVEVDFSKYTGEGHRIAFKNILRNSATYDYSYNYIDDIELDYRVVSGVLRASGAVHGDFRGFHGRHVVRDWGGAGVLGSGGHDSVSER